MSEKTEYFNPESVEEIDWEEYDKIWESKWKWEIN